MKGIHDYYAQIIHEFKKYKDERVANMLAVEIDEDGNRKHHLESNILDSLQEIQDENNKGKEKEKDSERKITDISNAKYF